MKAAQHETGLQLSINEPSPIHAILHTFEPEALQYSRLAPCTAFHYIKKVTLFTTASHCYCSTGTGTYRFRWFAEFIPSLYRYNK